MNMTPTHLEDVMSSQLFYFYCDKMFENIFVYKIYVCETKLTIKVKFVKTELL